MGCTGSRNVEPDEYMGPDPIDFSDDKRDRKKYKEEEDNKYPLEPGEFSGKEIGVESEETVKKILDSVEEGGSLFIDPRFSADDSSLYYNQEKPSHVRWLRPREMVNEPSLFVKGARRSDVQQGELGDCWFLAACASVAMDYRLLSKIVPEDQFLSGNSYSGLCRIRLWRFGRWVTVILDDRLPTQKKLPVYGRCDNTNEFWLPLLEKAYAKVHGTYQAIDGGVPMDALVDLTGGIAEMYPLQETNISDLFKYMYLSHKAGAFITTSKQGNMSNPVGRDGLVSGHAYTITHAARIRHQTGLVDLVRVRNPWGNEVEWNGPWSDGDDAWRGVSDATKKALHLEKKGDGEFWMDMNDFATKFTEVTICNLGPDYNYDGTVDRVGKILTIHGAWKKGVSAGGCRNNIKSYAMNPQYLLTISPRDNRRSSSIGSVRSMLRLSHGPRENPEDTTENSELVEFGPSPNSVWAIVSLMQEYRRCLKTRRTEMQPIGITVYKVKNSKPMSAREFRYRRSYADSGQYINLREVTVRLELPYGSYIIVPSTFQSGFSGEFMIRVFSSGAGSSLVKLK